MTVTNEGSSLKIAVYFLTFCATLISYGQRTEFKGRIMDAMTNELIPQVSIHIQGTQITAETNTSGEFHFKNVKMPHGEQIVLISKDGYITKRYPIIINEGKILDLNAVFLEYDINEEQLQIGIISLSDIELNDGEEDASLNISSLLQASRDVFLNAAAFDFSTTFFRPRGMGSEYGKVLINGIEMNKLSSGRPLWGTWGGLNDVQRNQEFSMGLAANEYTFGDLSGTTNMIMRASEYRKGGRVSYASSNRSYTGRIMATYNSGLGLNGWAYSVSLSRRFGTEGYIDGTLYEANAIFTSIEKKFNKEHSLNFTSFYTPNRRGKSTAITDEVYNLKGKRYNPNWGYYNGEKKNSKIKKVEEPILMLNHYWNLTNKTTLATNIALQTGSTSNSRIDTNGTDLISFEGQETYIGGGRSRYTNPAHPANVPSFYLQDINPTTLDFQNAFLAQQQFVENGQLDWDQLIEANQIQQEQNNNAVYVLFEDRNKDTKFTFSSLLNSKISDHTYLNASLDFRSLKSENFAEITDLLGGNGFLDIDAFALDDDRFSSSDLADRAQSDLRNPNKIVTDGDRYDYNYEINAKVARGFAQLQFQYNRFDFFAGGTVSQTSYQRNGLFENGYFPGDASFGKSEHLNFTNYGIKGGTTFKVNGRNSFILQGAFITKAPIIKNVFANVRKNNSVIDGSVGETTMSLDASYLLRTPKLNVRITGYYTDIKDATEVGFFFTETIALIELDETTGFVQENLTNIAKQYIGAELGISYQITPTIKLKGAAALGQFIYNNNPELSLSTDDGILSLGKVNLKNYKVANGPHNVAQIGLEYRDPDFWWVGATTNYFSNAYVDISPFKRSSNFNIDSKDGLPFNDYDVSTARSLLAQEQLNDYFLVNIVGGKSWRVKGYYVGFFTAISNILDQQYKTGGFEQSRRATYRSSLEESQRDTPIFGNKYFFGYGTSYYLNVYVRF